MPPARAATASARPRELDDLTLARAQRGDPGAFRLLIERYQDAVFALLWRFLGPNAHRAIVEDLAQTTFLGVFRALPRFTPGGPARLSTWILTIAARTALKERRGQPPQLLPVDELSDELSAPRAADDGVHRADFVGALTRALDELPPSHRIAFVLRAYHELDYQDIATALDVDLGTVKSRLWRARSQLRMRLKEFAP